MIAEDKLKAVQFWNAISEQLQEIVNNSAADINALTMEHHNDNQLNNSNHLTNDNVVVSNSSSHTNEDIYTDEQFVITALAQESSQDNQSELMIAFQEENSSKYPHSNSLQNGHSDDLIQKDFITSTTTSVIQEVERHNQIIRRNVIQSPQKAMQVLNNEVNFQPEMIKDNNENSKFNQLNNCNQTNAQTNAQSNVMESIMTSDSSVSSSILASNENSCDISDLMEYDSDDDSNEIAKKDDDTKQNENTDENKKKDKRKKTKKEKKLYFDVDDNGNFKCLFCELVFDDKPSLMDHKCTNSKSFKCIECDATFSTKNNLIIHRRKHTGERPYNCDQCSARFSTRGNLKRHINTHTGNYS